MDSIKIKNAFTLIELMVWITILSIILLSVSNIDFSRLNIKQELEIFTNNIKSNFESIRNSSLSWKWIWTDLYLPDRWKIEYSTSNSWTIINSTFSWSTESELENNLIFKPWFTISKIKCLLLNWDLDNDITDTWTWIIEFTWSKITLGWDCNNTSKILELTIKNKYETKTLQINTLNWLAEIK